jgi:hypothetical protein
MLVMLFIQGFAMMSKMSKILAVTSLFASDANTAINHTLSTH